VLLAVSVLSRLEWLDQRKIGLVSKKKYEKRNSFLCFEINYYVCHTNKEFFDFKQLGKGGWKILTLHPNNSEQESGH